MKKISYILFVIAAISITTNSFAQKKWSPQAKGAAVGAGGGAVLGAVLDRHNRGAGAVIGGVIGGGVGYAYGKHRAKEAREARIAAANRAARNRAARTKEVVVYKPYPVYKGYTTSEVNNSGHFNSQSSYAAYQPNANNTAPYADYLSRRKSW